MKWNKKDEWLMLFYTEGIQENNTTWRASYSAHMLLRESVEQHKSPVILSAQQRDRRRAERHALLLNTRCPMFTHYIQDTSHVHHLWPRALNGIQPVSATWHSMKWWRGNVCPVYQSGCTQSLSEPLSGAQTESASRIFLVELPYLLSTTVIKKFFKLLFYFILNLTTLKNTTYTSVWLWRINLNVLD